MISDGCGSHGGHCNDAHASDAGGGSNTDGLGPYVQGRDLRLSINGALIVEQTHEFVIKKPIKNAPNQ